MFGAGISVCFLSGCVGNQESNGKTYTLSTSKPFNTDYIGIINYKVDENVDDFQITSFLETHSDDLDTISVYDENDYRVGSFEISDGETQITWTVSEQPTDTTFKLVVYGDNMEIDRSILHTEYK